MFAFLCCRVVVGEEASPQQHQQHAMGARWAACRPAPFTAAQYEELEHQALIYKYLVAGVPVPPDLLLPIRRGFDSLAARFYHHPARTCYFLHWLLRFAAFPSLGLFVYSDREIQVYPVSLLICSRSFVNPALDLVAERRLILSIILIQTPPRLIKICTYY